MKNKQYQAPKISKVKLVIKNSILSVCHSSPNMTPRDAVNPCELAPGCYDAGG